MIVNGEELCGSLGYGEGGREPLWTSIVPDLPLSDPIDRTQDDRQAFGFVCTIGAALKI